MPSHDNLAQKVRGGAVNVSNASAEGLIHQEYALAALSETMNPIMFKLWFRGPN